MATKRTVARLLIGLATVVGVAALPAQRIDPDAVDATVERIRKEMRIPGVAVVIVHRDSVVHARGYGVREIGSDDPVDSRTLFAIGSGTKAFTATLIGTLVDDGALRWDDRVIDHLPDFALKDPYATAEITIRDLLAHRSGLPAANLMWLTKSRSRDTLIRRLRWLEPATGFRSALTYQNLSISPPVESPRR